MEVFSDELEILKTYDFIIDEILPPLYHSGNLEGIQTELKVVNELMKKQNKRIYRKGWVLTADQSKCWSFNLGSHLIMLREISMRENGHEPPLCNPYNMQWLLTLFGSSLPKGTILWLPRLWFETRLTHFFLGSILRIWDGLFLDGNEVLIRATIAVWKFFEAEILQTQTTDQFYQTMNAAMETMTSGSKIQEYELVSGWFGMIPKISRIFQQFIQWDPFPYLGLMCSGQSITENLKRHRKIRHFLHGYRDFHCDSLDRIRFMFQKKFEAPTIRL